MKSKKEYKVVVPLLSDTMIAVWGEGFDIERNILEKIGVTLVEADMTHEEQMTEVVKDADAIICGGGARINRKMIESLEKCKIIALRSIGYNLVDITACTSRGIYVTNVPDVFVEEVADHTMTLLLASWRRLPVLDTIVRSRRWIEADLMLNQIPRLMGRNLGLLGFGHIARAVSKRAKAFGFRMMAYDPFISELDMVGYEVEPITELSELLSCCDFISSHLPLTSETYHMISGPQFKQMKPSAVFINTGRGSTVDESALVMALQEGEISFAAMDVFEEEPLSQDNPLLQLKNVILTPHAASASSRKPVEARRRAAREVERVLEGGVPISPVNRIVGQVEKSA